MQDIRRTFRLLTARRRQQAPMPFRRVVKYYRHRIRRLPGTPHQIAAGFAAGVAVSATPFLGLHIVIGFVICLALRLSAVAMVIGSVVGGNPWTFPFLWVGSYELGQWLLVRRVENTADITHLSLADLMRHPLDLLWPMTVGSVPIALLLGMVSYLVARVSMRQRARQRGL